MVKRALRSNNFNDDHSALICYICKKSIKKNILSCGKCDLNYHQKCVKFSINKYVCVKCNNSISNSYKYQVTSRLPIDPARKVVNKILKKHHQQNNVPQINPYKIASIPISPIRQDTQHKVKKAIISSRKRRFSNELENNSDQEGSADDNESIEDHASSITSSLRSASIKSSDKIQNSKNEYNIGPPPPYNNPLKQQPRTSNAINPYNLKGGMCNIDENSNQSYNSCLSSISHASTTTNKRNKKHNNKGFNNDITAAVAATPHAGSNVGIKIKNEPPSTTTYEHEECDNNLIGMSAAPPIYDYTVLPHAYRNRSQFERVSVPDEKCSSTFDRSLIESLLAKHCKTLLNLSYLAGSTNISTVSDSSGDQTTQYLPKSSSIIPAPKMDNNVKESEIFAKKRGRKRKIRNGISPQPSGMKSEFLDETSTKHGTTINKFIKVTDFGPKDNAANTIHDCDNSYLVPRRSSNERTDHLFNAATLKKTCPYIGCDGRGHLSGLFPRHFTLGSCPPFHRTTADACIRRWNERIMPLLRRLLEINQPVHESTVPITVPTTMSKINYNASSPAKLLPSKNESTKATVISLKSSPTSKFSKENNNSSSSSYKRLAANTNQNNQNSNINSTGVSPLQSTYTSKIIIPSFKETYPTAVEQTVASLNNSTSLQSVTAVSTEPKKVFNSSSIDIAKSSPPTTHKVTKTSVVGSSGDGSFTNSPNNRRALKEPLKDSLTPSSSPPPPPHKPNTVSTTTATKASVMMASSPIAANKNNQYPFDDLIISPTSTSNASCDLQIFLDVQAILAAVQESDLEPFDPPFHVNRIVFGNIWEFNGWYPSPFPLDRFGRINTVYFCEFCLDFQDSEIAFLRHSSKCNVTYPPGNEIYREGPISIFEVDGRTQIAYCRNLCLLSKLFMESKTLCYEVQHFWFYVMTLADKRGSCHIIGYFSKEKQNFQKNTVSCILILPHFMRRGYGWKLIDFSYLLTRLEDKIGSPEKPLSDHGLVTYRSYWNTIILNYLSNQCTDDKFSIKDLSAESGVHQDDIVSTLQYYRLLKSWRGNHILLKKDIEEMKRISKPLWKNLPGRVDPKYLKWTPK